MTNRHVTLAAVAAASLSIAKALELQRAEQIEIKKEPLPDLKPYRDDLDREFSRPSRDWLKREYAKPRRRP